MFRRLALGLLLAPVILGNTPRVEVSYEWSTDGRWVVRRSPTSVAYVYRDGWRMGFPPKGRPKGFTEESWAMAWYRFDATMVKAGNTYGIDPVLIKAILWEESRFNTRAKSKAGAIGIGQLMPGTAKALGVKDPMNPEECIWGTAAHLRRSADQFRTQNMVVLVSAYNSGDEAVKKALRRVKDMRDPRIHDMVPKNRETPGYVDKVLWTFDRIHRGLV